MDAFWMLLVGKNVFYTLIHAVESLEFVCGSLFGLVFVIAKLVNYTRRILKVDKCICCTD